MRKILVLGAVVAALFFSACEKDDICAGTTPTTPRLVIDFFDQTNSSVAKNLTNFSAREIDEQNRLVFNPELTGEARFFTSANSVSLPLRLDQDETTYIITNFNGNTNLVNTDTLTISYARREIYVSRACGYKVNFDLIDVTRDGGTDNNWIQNIIREQTNIETENEAHLTVYF